jgi:putative oxidoreductase
MPVGYAEARNIVLPRLTSWPHCLAMKILTHISRFLLGLIFLIFGLNGFLHFIPMPPPSGVAGQFLGSMFVTKYLLFVFAIQLIGGVLVLINRYVPIALTILGPIVVNILLFHGLMDPAGLGLALLVTILWGVVFVSVRSAFAGIFLARVDTKTAPARRSVGISSATA